MKILLIGGTGVLSSEVMNCSVAGGHDVFVVNRGNRRDIIPDNVHLLQADINDSVSVKKLIKGRHFDIVVDFLCYKKEQVEKNIPLFANSCNHYIYISSCAVYDINARRAKYDEDSPLINLLWQYSVDKVECEKTVSILCNKHELKYTIVRPAVTYGNTRIPYGIAPPYGYHWTLVERILNNKPILLWDQGLNAMNIMRVEDFAKGFLALYGNVQAYGQVFNITGNEYVKWVDVINALGELLGKSIIFANVPKEFLADEMPNRRGEILGGRGVSLMADNAKIKHIAPEMSTTISLKEGLAKTLDYYRKHNFLCGIDYSFDANMDRIVNKYYERNDPHKLKAFKLIYIDYFKTKRLSNWIIYLINRHSDYFLVRQVVQFQEFLVGHVGRLSVSRIKKVFVKLYKLRCFD